ncbi:MAG: hypothetical protein AB8U25_06680 [Rickettsiales endosymbiont of Dermacentor nuttalli]
MVRLEKLLKPKIYGANVGNKDEEIIKALCVLDKYAPIRLQDCVVSLDSLGILMLTQYQKKVIVI